MANTERQQSTSTHHNQYLTFTIGKEHFGMELHQTREIIEYAGITEVPLMPQFLSGVINLRGEVVPVIDLSVRLGREPIKIHKRTCVIVIELHGYEQYCVLGLLADAVNEVVELPVTDVEEAPAFGAKIRAEFIQGIAKVNDEFIILLDAEKTLSPIELASLVEAELQ
ncbi:MULTISPECIES: chemotaxis protein CheW [Thalassotalea]|uniref:chemotaxis protein CheW n=1 Tax=Thalassotalea TaxID=1518149 RepID=UPI00257280E0|nr:MULTISPECIES: chemotaxis protein CheW [Thalassotalea]MDO6427395.1 chemotaxis protein CheW [Thalassotalea sp. 1_MG-2023]